MGRACDARLLAKPPSPPSLRAPQVFEKDGTISFDDFREYYHDLGSLIEDDVYFEWMLRSAWKVGGSSYIAKNDKSFGAHNDHHAH